MPHQRLDQLRLKQLRFVSHIEWADKHGKLAEASTFLRGLEESEWHHFGD